MALALGRRLGFPADKNKKMSADRWRRVESLCHAALARPAGERDAFLAEVCGDDESLRAEVAALLAGAESAPSFLETPIGASLPSLVGRQLGAYRIDASIGAGGMGEVYRAKDTRLGRDVAVKILPTAFTTDPQRRTRFEREARAVAALNHPNICTIHDVGHDQGIDFLVMELVDGESLAARLAKGPLPLEEALARAIEIADALDSAHRQRIIHRDLKPGNVMLAKTGLGKAHATQAKLLDFGLARILPSDLDSVAADLSRITKAGAMLGTLEYMAPEQIEGQPADARTDIFAFGALLYEMLTGRRAFEGATAAVVMAAILREDPPPVHPRELGRIVRRCLAKDPLRRYQSTRDLLNDLEDTKQVLDSGELETRASAQFASAISRARVAWMVAGAALLLAAAAGWYELNGRPADRPMVRSSLIAPEGTEFDFSEGAPALSPDGRRVAFLARRPNGARQIWIRALDTLPAQPLAGTEGATHPFWAPDGTALGFFSNLKLRRLDLSSGAIRSLCDVQRAARGGTWGPDGTILFPRSGASEIYRVSADGGSPVAVTEFDARRDETIPRFPAFLPDGRHFLFISDGRADPQGRNTVFVGSLDSRTRKPITWTHSSAVYSTSGHLLFLRDVTLFAQRFDVSRLTLVGAPVEIAKWAAATVRNEAVLSVATDAALVYQTGRGDADVAQLAWMDRNGNQLATVGPRSVAYSVELSNDGRKVAVGVLEKGYDISVRDLERGTTAEIHFESWNAVSPVWSPDDRRLFFGFGSGTASNRVRKIVSTTADGTGMQQAVYVPSDGQPGVPTSISSDGAVLVTTIRKESGGLGHAKHDYDIRVLALAGDAPPFLNRPELFEMNGQLAPGTRSRWLAYQVEKSGSPEVYVQRLDREQTRVKISTAGGSHPRWRRDGRELFYVSPEQQLMAVEITLEPQFSVGVPRSLFAAKFRPVTPFQYDVALDGQRFLVLQAVLDEPLTLIQNWTKAFPSK
ncbi:MAG TPA: protein kinase [Vicinamibacterales bacterium]|nr:protein kinase [Vicinamibacterales bacterium]